MKKNVGRTDRIVRLALGVVLPIVGVLGDAGYANLAFLGFGQALAAVAGFLVAVVLLGTSAASASPIYRILGNDTRRGVEPTGGEAAVEKSA